MIIFLILGISMADVYISSLAGQPSDALVRDMKALELFLKDQEDHQLYCPRLSWAQPDIKVYKEKLELGAYYTYNKDNKKVYDIKSMRQDFKELIKKLKK